MLLAVEAVRVKSGAGWRCLCDCGKETAVATSWLTSGNTKSCGCGKSKGIISLNEGRKITGHPCTTHGYSSDPLHVIWRMLINRCLNPKSDKWKDYGGRGISVDSSWFNFEVFKADMGIRPKNYTVERLDNSLGYSKSNCVWASKADQALNTRSNVLLTFNNKTQTMVEWARELKLNYSTVKNRYRLGKSVDKILKATTAKRLY